MLAPSPSFTDGFKDCARHEHGFTFPICLSSNSPAYIHRCSIMSCHIDIVKRLNRSYRSDLTNALKASMDALNS